MNINIASTQYTLSTKSLEIYVSGCSGNPKCKNCHNPELWDFNIGEELTNQYLHKKIINKYDEFKDIIDNIMVFGGEPLDQPYDHLLDLLYELSQLGSKVWIFTRYDFKDVNSEILKYCDYIKCGRYEESLKTEDNTQYGIKLATSNQNIYKKGKDY